MPTTARLSVDAIVAQHRQNVTDVATYQSACKVIDSLVKSGQVIESDAEAAKAQLLAHAFATVASAAANAKNDGKPSMKVTPGGMVGFGRSAPGANQQYGLSLFPKTLQWLFEHREVIEQFIAANSGELSWTKADADRFAERKAKAKAEYEAKKAAAAKA